MQNHNPKFKILAISFLMLLGCFTLAGSAQAGINLPWSSTFNCADWVQVPDVDTLGCDNWNLNSYNSCTSGGLCSVMNSSANNPLGSGKGFRVAVHDGRNDQAATPHIYFNSSQHEIWVRWYQRWPSSTNLSSDNDGLKLLYYALEGTINAGYIALHQHNMQLYTQDGGTQNISHYFDFGSYELFGSQDPGDNKWHAMEMHFKGNSSYSACDGIWEVWVDGIKIGSHNDVDLFADFTDIMVNCNQQITTSPSGIDIYIDYDDFVIQTNGYIGPISEQQPTCIVTPSAGNGGIISPSSPQTVNCGDTKQFTITPNSGYYISSCTGCGGSLIGNTYTTGAITSNCTVTATFLQSDGGGTILFQEDFDDTNFSSRGWYDSTGGTITTTQNIPESAASFECYFKNSANGPVHNGACEGGTPARHKFTPINSVYVNFWIKHSPTWTGKGTHIFYLLTTEDEDYAGLARNHLDAYINEGTVTNYVMDMELQDALNIDESNINVDLTQVTENRASQGCNGLLDNSQDFVSCYESGTNQHTNMRNWKVPNAFTTSPGSYYMQDWHHIEAYYVLNSIDGNGKGKADGVLQFWFDGQLIINKNTVSFRTGAHPNMLFNQLILAPYMGTSEVDQTFWIDDLTVATARAGTDATPPSAPSGLMVS